jgi:ribosomal-protein-alanine N-acetyltransferase
MFVADISAVTRLEQMAYGPAYTRRDFQRELEQNRLARYFVMRVKTPQLPIIGLGGFWIMAGEIHIMTLAIHPQWQGLGLGEWLLLTLLEQGQSLGANTVTLEVRPSNSRAMALYKKYRFQQVGYRRKYYADGEDAFILMTPSFDSSAYQAILTQRKVRLLQKLVKLELDKSGSTS